MKLRKLHKIIFNHREVTRLRALRGVVSVSHGRSGSAYLFDFRVALESKLVTVRKVGKLFLREVDASLGDVVHLALLEPCMEVLSDSIECGASDFASFVHECHVEQFPLATLIRPCLEVRLLCAARLDGPNVLIRAQCLDGQNSRPTRFGLLLLDMDLALLSFLVDWLGSGLRRCLVGGPSGTRLFGSDVFVDALRFPNSVFCRANDA